MNDQDTAHNRRSTVIPVVRTVQVLSGAWTLYWGVSYVERLVTDQTENIVVSGPLTLMGIFLGAIAELVAQTRPRKSRLRSLGWCLILTVAPAIVASQALIAYILIAEC